MTMVMMTAMTMMMPLVIFEGLYLMNRWSLHLDGDPFDRVDWYWSFPPRAETGREQMEKVEETGEQMEKVKEMGEKMGGHCGWRGAVVHFRAVIDDLAK